MRNLRGRPANFQKKFFLASYASCAYRAYKEQIVLPLQQWIGGGVETSGVPLIPYGQRRCELQRQCLGFAVRAPKNDHGGWMLVQETSSPLGYLDESPLQVTRR
jgi:hypothetical protein